MKTKTAAASRQSKRFAILLGLAPRKLGSFEDWLGALCSEARQRGHELAIWGLEPVHPKMAAELARLGIAWRRWDLMMRSPIDCIRSLAHYDLLYICMFGVLDPICLMAYATWGTRVVFVGHADVADEGPARSIHRQALSSVLKRVVAARLDGLVGVSEYIERRYREWFGMSARKTRTIYNGVDSTRFRPGRRPSNRTSGTALLTAANLVPGKGLRHLLHAFARLEDPTTSLVVAGDGPDEMPLKELAASLGVQTRVSFVGLRDDVHQLLQQADIFVHPAVSPEAFGLTLAEAMAAECAVVASRIGGMPEVVKDGVTGILVPPGDETALKCALERLVRDPRYRQALGTNGRQRAIEVFNLQTCVTKHLDWCEEVVSRRGSVAQIPPPTCVERSSRSSNNLASTDGPRVPGLDHPGWEDGTRRWSAG